MKRFLICLTLIISLFIGTAFISAQETISTDLPAVPSETLSTDATDPIPAPIPAPPVVEEPVIVEEPCPCAVVAVEAIDAEPVTIKSGYKGSLFEYEYNGPYKHIKRSFDRCTGERYLLIEHKKPCKKVIIEKKVVVEPVKRYRVKAIEVKPCVPCAE